MIPKQAIEKAIEGGWRPKGVDYPTVRVCGVSNSGEEVMFDNGESDSEHNL